MFDLLYYGMMVVGGLISFMVFCAFIGSFHSPAESEKGASQETKGPLHDPFDDFDGE
jgi:hypothetical protein